MTVNLLSDITIRGACQAESYRSVLHAARLPLYRLRPALRGSYLSAGRPGPVRHDLGQRPAPASRGGSRWPSLRRVPFGARARGSGARLRLCSPLGLSSIGRSHLTFHHLLESVALDMWASVRWASAVGNEGLADHSNYGEGWRTDALHSPGVESLLAPREACAFLRASAARPGRRRRAFIYPR